MPEGFSDDVVAVGRLTVDQRRRFEAAGQWRAAASRLQDTHAGSWYIALVAAIEALTDEPDVPDPCPSCGHDRSQRPTASFKDFLEKYAAGPGRRSQMDQLYRVRSSLVHGRELVDVSWRLLGLDFSPRTMRTTSHSFQLETLVSLAIVNWLRDVAPAA